jgi:hypothetical protein
MLKAKRVIPMHCGTFPPPTGSPQQLAELIKDLPALRGPLGPVKDGRMAGAWVRHSLITFDVLLLLD